MLNNLNRTNCSNEISTEKKIGALLASLVKDDTSKKVSNTLSGKTIN